MRVVSWDLDGTLYALPRLKRALAKLALRRLVRAPLTTWRELRFLGRHHRWMAGVRAAGGEQGLPPPWDSGVWQPISDRWYPPLLAELGPHPAARQLVETLAGRGLRQVVVSDYVAEPKLAALGLEAHFEAVFSGERLGVLKPSPRLFTEVCSRLQIRPDELLHIGDRHDTDGLAASDAGCRVRVVQPRDLASMHPA